MRLVIPEEPAVQVAPTAKVDALGPSPLRLGVLDNSKGNADHLLADLVARLQAATAIAGVVSARKPAAAAAAGLEVIDRLAQEADCVITAMAD